MAAVRGLGVAQRSIQPPFAVLSDYVAGGMLISRVLYVVAELGVADLLAAGPRPVRELASQLAVNEDALYRILRAASSVGVFEEVDGRAFRTNALGQHLESGRKNSMRAWARYVGAPWHQEVWNRLLDSVRDGKDLYQHLYGERFFDHLAHHPDQSAMFDAGMTGLSSLSDDAIANAGPFRAAKTVIDVAGGAGGQLAAILTRHPRLRGTLFDQPSVIADARELWRMRWPHLLPRVDFAEGNFFERIPGGHDVILLKSIVHDWEDARASALLATCRAALSPGSKLVLVEMVIERRNTAHFGPLLDIAMLALTGGRERTRDEYSSLFQSAGLVLERVTPTASPYSLVQGRQAMK